MEKFTDLTNFDPTDEENLIYRVLEDVGINLPSEDNLFILDNKKIHNLIWFPTNTIVFWQDEHAEKTLVLFQNNFTTAQKTLYYLGGENDSNLVFFYDNFCLYEVDTDRIKDKLIKIHNDLNEDNYDEDTDEFNQN